MRKWLLLVGVMLSSMGCEDVSPTVPADLSGPNSIGLAGGILLVASAGNDELRALDVSQDPARFVRAPNPLYPLSIPTASMPRAVASYTNSDGVAASLAFALSTSSAQVTAISTKRLVSLGPVTVPASTLAIALLTHVQGKPLQLVVAGLGEEKEGKKAGEIYIGEFAEAIAESPTAKTELQAIKLELKYTMSDFQPQSLAVSPSDPTRFAVADRLGGAEKKQGLRICDLGQVECQSVDVGGPLNAIAFNSAGTRLFGVFDPETRPDEAASCNGVVAVDIKDGSFTVAGRVEIPGTPRGIAVASGETAVTLPSGQVVSVTDLVLVSSSDGNLYPLDGQAMQTLSGSDWNRVVLRNPEGSTSFAAEDDLSGVAMEGSINRDELVTVTWEGVVSTGNGVVENKELVSSGTDFKAQGVQEGDWIKFDGAQNCAVTEIRVGAVSGSALGLPDLEVGCLPSNFGYTIRVAEQYLVRSSIKGVLGRVGRGNSFQASNLSFQVGDRILERDWAYEIEFKPYHIAAEIGLTMPGAVASHPLKGQLYTVYSGGDGVAVIDLAEIRSGTDNGVTVFQ